MNRMIEHKTYRLFSSDPKFLCCLTANIFSVDNAILNIYLSNYSFILKQNVAYDKGKKAAYTDLLSSV